MACWGNNGHVDELWARGLKHGGGLEFGNGLGLELQSTELQQGFGCNGKDHTTPRRGKHKARVWH